LLLHTHIHLLHTYFNRISDDEEALLAKRTITFSHSHLLAPLNTITLLLFPFFTDNRISDDEEALLAKRAAAKAEVDAAAASGNNNGGGGGGGGGSSGGGGVSPVSRGRRMSKVVNTRQNRTGTYGVGNTADDEVTASVAAVTECHQLCSEYFGRVCVCVCAGVCVYVCVFMSVCVRVCACIYEVSACGDGVSSSMQ
jgi:hypothetical protein